MLSNPKIYIFPSVTLSTYTFLFPLIAEKNVREREREDGRYRERERERVRELVHAKREKTSPKR